MTVFAGEDEGFDHIGVLEVAVELVEFVEPEIVTKGYAAVKAPVTAIRII